MAFGPNITYQMWRPFPVCKLELTKPLPNSMSFVQYRKARALLTWKGVPVAWQDIPVEGEALCTSGLVERILDNHIESIARQALRASLLAGPALTGSELVQAAGDEASGRLATDSPSVSVVVCTRDRPEDILECLNSLMELEPKPLEVIVVDNAASDASTRRIVADFAGVRYIEEPRPGLDWARNRGVLEARGEIVAFADDDVVVDKEWVLMLAQTFKSDPQLGGVTGLIAPLEFETCTQEHFELYGGFDRGFTPKWVHHPTCEGRVPWYRAGTGDLGSGANMAFRRDVLLRIGLFAPELDTGTVTEGGGDLEVFFRVIKRGYPIAYEPKVLVWHRHRKDAASLSKQLGSWGVGFFAHLEHARRLYPDESRNIRRLELYRRRCLFQWALGQYLRPARVPRDLRITEIVGSFKARARYGAARRRALEIEQEYGPQCLELPTIPAEAPSDVVNRQRMAIRYVDLAVGLTSIDDVTNYWKTRVNIMLRGRPLGHVDIDNRGLSISQARIANAMAASVPVVEWMQRIDDVSEHSAQATLRTRLRSAIFPCLDTHPKNDTRLPVVVAVSVVLATCDRPTELRRCLMALSAMKHERPVQLIVVDNRPASGQTAQIVQEFPGVQLVEEPRPGLSYARNAGFAVATGDVIVCTDDDVMFGDDWLERLVAPFVRNDIDIVCGNVLPMELETESQLRFEQYGGLGKGYRPIEADANWFFEARSAPETWTLGATANAAFRSALLRDPDVGPFEEALGPGVPSGVGEDTYFFYRALRSGYGLRYEPSSWVEHQHRSTLESLKRQLLDYSKGHVAYNLHTLITHGDLRALTRCLDLSRWHARRLRLLLLALARLGWDKSGRQPHYPFILIATEIMGNLLGPWSLLRSYQLVKKRRCGAHDVSGNRNRNLQADSFGKPQ